LLSGKTQAVEITGIEDAERLRTMLGDTPAKLLFGHKTVENHHLGRECFDPRIKGRIVNRDFVGLNTNRFEIERMLTALSGGGEMHLPAAKL
jgi:hypothetical protein